MSRVTIRKWYERVNSTWPAEVPPLTKDEAIRAAKKLYRFVRHETFRGTVTVTSGRNYSRAARYSIVVNPDRGWRDLIHDLSHWLCRDRHGGSHARVERRMIKEVLKRGWLEGNLKSTPKAIVRPVEKRYSNAVNNLKRWRSKLKRAETAIKKLERRVKYYEGKRDANQSEG